MTEDFQMHNVPRDFLEREITALRESIMHGGDLWNESEVPIDLSAFDVWSFGINGCHWFGISDHGG